MKKILALLLSVIAVMASVNVFATETTDTGSIVQGENGYWEFESSNESNVMPLATDNGFATFTIPIGPSAYRNVTVNPLVLSSNENAIGIEFQSFTPRNAGMYFNILNMTDNEWVESSWMRHDSLTGYIYYVFYDSYLKAHPNAKYAVEMYTVNATGTATLRTFTTTR